MLSWPYAADDQILRAMRNSIAHLLLSSALSFCPRHARKDGCRRLDRIDIALAPLADTRLDHHVDRAAGHDQVLHVVAPDENEAATAIEVGLLDDVEAPLRFRSEELGNGVHGSGAAHIGAHRKCARDDGGGKQDHDRKIVRNVPHFG